MASTSQSVIAALRANLVLESGQFQKGAQGAGKQADTLRGRIAKAFSKIPGLESLSGGLTALKANLGAIAATAAVALGGLSVSAVNSAKEIQNMSRIAGTLPEDFQKIAYAGEQVGISQEKMADILKDVNDRVGDFIATGGGPMADFFERIAPKIGVTADQFRNLSGADALQLYVSSLEKANLSQSDFTFFMEAMASDSTALVPLLRNGGKAAAEYGKRLEALGGVKSNETIAKLAAMKTTFNELRVVMASIRDTLGAAFAPIMNAVIAGFNSLMLRGSGLRLALDGVAGAIGSFASGAASAINIISHLVAFIWNGIRAGVQWANQFTGIGNLISQVWAMTGGRILSIIQNTSVFLDQVGGMGNAISMLGELAQGVWAGIVSSAKAIPPGLAAIWATVQGQFYTMVAGLVGKWQGFLEYMSGSLAGVPGMEGAQGALFGQIAKADGIGQSFKNAANAANATAQSYRNVAAGIVSGGFDQARATLQKMNEVVAAGKANADAADTSFTNFGSTLDQFNKGGGSGSNKAADVIKKLREELAKLTETMGMTAQQEAIWTAQRQAGVLSGSAQGQLIADLVAQTEALKEQKSAIEGMKNAFGTAFSSIITGASSARDAMKNLFSTIASNLANRGVNALLDGLMGGSGGGGWLGKVAGWLFGGVGKNANGTSNWRGGLSMVGERGPELVNMPQGSRVYNSQQTRSMLNDGGTARIQIDLSPDLEARILDAAASQSVQITKSGIHQNNKGHNARNRQYQSDPYQA